MHHLAHQTQQPQMKKPQNDKQHSRKMKELKKQTTNMGQQKRTMSKQKSK